MPGLYTEADYENSVIELFRNDLGYDYAYGPDIERDFYSPLYEDVLYDCIERINSDMPIFPIMRCVKGSCPYWQHII